VDSEAEDKATHRISDVAIAQLQTSVPSPMASPMNFLPGGLPDEGTWVTDVGLGGRTLDTCGEGQSDRQKGYMNFQLDVSGTNRRDLDSSTTLVCHGDSGGPVFTGPDRKIFWVNSSRSGLGDPSNYFVRYGEVWRLTTQIEDYMANWSCPAGMWWDNQPVNKDQRYPYARVCGLDRQNYECTPASHQWQSVGGSCGTAGCQCPNGSAFGDVAIAPDRTSCGSTVCGRDQIVYRCTSGGWQPETANRCGPRLEVIEDFSVMPSWTSVVNAWWGGAATWSRNSDGQLGTSLKAERYSAGSSARVKVYPITPNTTYTASIYMKVKETTADFWAEAAIKLGTFTAADFDSSPGTWTMIKKLDKSTGGTGDAWVHYSITFDSGTNLNISVGFKLGYLSGSAAVARWDSLRIQ
jgi:hypothetical protein